MNLMFITTAMAQEAMVPEEVGEEQTLSIIELITSGGIGGNIIMLVLLLLSIVAIYIFVERFLTIGKAGVEDPAFFNGLKDSIQKSDLATAKALCTTTNTLFLECSERVLPELVVRWEIFLRL